MSLHSWVRLMTHFPLPTCCCEVAYQQNILAKHKAGFTAEAWEKFMKAWNALISATTVESYQEQLQVKFCLPFTEDFLTEF